MKYAKGMFIWLLAALYAPVTSAGLLYGIQESGDRLVSIDPTTLAITDIGALGVTFNFGGLAYDRNSSTMYMVDGRASNSLYTVDLNTGAASLIGAHGITDLFGLAYDSVSDVLYGSTRFSGAVTGALYSLDASNGAGSLIGSAGVPLDGLAFDSQRNQLIGHRAGGNSGVYEVSRSDAAATLLFSDNTFVNNNGLAYDYEQDLFFSADWGGNLFSIDPSNGYQRSTLLSNLGAFDGFAFVGERTTTPVPEPATVALLGLGLGLLSLRLRRKA